MTFMTKEQRMRHTAKPGLSGLAQVNGRNAITWEEKMGWDNQGDKYPKAIVGNINNAIDGNMHIECQTTKFG